MIKAMGALMTGMACAYCGIKHSARIRRRYKYLTNIQKVLEILETKIDFLQRDIKNALKDINTQIDTNGFLDEVISGMEKNSACTAWKKALTKKADSMCLNDEDCDTVAMLAPRLGMTDVKNQINNIEYVKNMLDIHIKAAHYDVKTRCRLYTGSGVLTGVFLVMMFL